MGRSKLFFNFYLLAMGLIALISVVKRVEPNVYTVWAVGASVGMTLAYSIHQIYLHYKEKMEDGK